jgi:uncharacterized membrane protein YdjX (TVP38/TMEM64 family)
VRQDAPVMRAQAGRVAWGRWGVAAGVGLGLVGLALLLRVHAGHLLTPRALAAMLAQVRASPLAVPGFLTAYVALTSLFAPAVAFHLAAGAVWGLGRGLAFNLLAFHLTCQLQFLATRRLGAGRVVHLLGEARVEALERRLARDGWRAAMLVRLLPLPNLAVNVAAGLSPLRWRDYTLGTLVGTLPIIGVYTSLAAALVDGAEGAQQQALLQVALGGAGVVGLALLSRVLARRTG